MRTDTRMARDDYRTLFGEYPGVYLLPEQLVLLADDEDVLD